MAMKIQSNTRKRTSKKTSLVHAYASLLNIRNEDLNYDDDLHIAYCVLCKMLLENSPSKETEFFGSDDAFTVLRSYLRSSQYSHE